MKKPQILIISGEKDVHAKLASSILERDFGMSVIRDDFSRFPLQHTLTYSVGAKSPATVFKTIDNGQIDIDRLISIWWRRPGRFEFDKGVTNQMVENFCYRECAELVRGMLVATEIPVINDPEADRTAHLKPLQLKIAQEIGMVIPETLMSNDSEEIRAFWERFKGKIIYKVFTSPQWMMAETRVLNREDLEDLDKLRHAPIICQELIHRGLDIRVNIFGNELYAAEVHPEREEADLDWRIDLTARYKPHALPAEVENSLFELLRRFRLHTGVIDLRMDQEGRYVFFEINPSGQYMFVESDTKLPLTESMCKLLAGKNEPVF